MKQILRASFGLAALVAGCHRDLDVPDCAYANACADPDTGGDTAIDSSQQVDTAAATETEADGTIEDAVDAVVNDAADATTDSADVATDTPPDVGSDACASMTCTSPPSATCASTTTRRTFATTGTCSAGTCTYAATDITCPPGTICSGGTCDRRSCEGGLRCSGVSCCESKTLPAGTFLMGRGGTGAEVDVCSTWASGTCSSEEQPEHSATVASFGLDTFEVTVGRFRRFVAAYPLSKPAAGAGAHVLIAGSGWQSVWDSNLPATAADLRTALKCDPGYQTWRDTPGGSTEFEAINCVNWYLAFAFCAWDGGRLPTEAEWEYAAAGGAEDRVLPWGTTPPDSTLANGGCAPSCGSGARVAPVGTASLGISRWGQYDLAGNVLEWTLDAHAPYTTAAKTNYATLTGSSRVLRGSNFALAAGTLRSSMRGWYEPPTSVSPSNGFRCAH